MHINELKVGDLLFVRNGEHDFVHAGICVEAGGTYQTTKMAHTLGKAEPFCLVAAHLAPKEILEEKGLYYLIIRIKPQNLIDIALSILQSWLLHLIPYDQKKYDELVKRAITKRLIGTEGSLNDYTQMERDSLINNEIEYQNKLYENSKYRIITLSATRNIGPTPPVPLSTEVYVEGIICTSPIIMLLQIAAFADYIATVDSFWVSDEYVSQEELRRLLNPDLQAHRSYLKFIQQLKSQSSDNTALQFHSALRLLKVPLEELDFSKIPRGVRLDPYLCPVSVLYYSLLQDTNHFQDMGTLEMPHYEDAKDLKAAFDQNISNLIKSANLVREKSYKKVNFDSGCKLFNNAFEEIKNDILRPKPRQNI